MLLLLFRISDNRYALDATEVVEVVPLVELKLIPQAPAFVAGLFDYRGTAVPVIDLCQLGSGRSCQPRMTSRIILITYTGPGGGQHTLGLLAEQVTETIKLTREEFTDSGITISDAPYLGDMAHTDKGIIQLVKTRYLLPEHVRALLFNADAA